MQRVEIVLLKMIISNIKWKIVCADLYCLSLMCIHIVGVSSMNKYRVYK